MYVYVYMCVRVCGKPGICIRTKHSITSQNQIEKDVGENINRPNQEIQDR